MDHTQNAKQEDGRVLSMPWWNFAALRGSLQDIFSTYELKLGIGYQVGEAAKELLRKSRRAANGYENAVNLVSINQETLRAELLDIGFARELSPEQARNVSKMAALSAAATFSVPGAGKTTEALAFFFFKAREAERLLVVAPKNAFAAWDEQVTVCMPHLNASFCRLRGGRDKIERMLMDDPRFMLITYQQLARVGDLLAAHLAKHKTFLFLDESHRIKSGTAKQTARAVLGLSHLPVGKLIMSGTPMPQAFDDLIPQFSFLYPEIEASPDDIVDKVKPIYVRTNKAELGLPPITRHRVSLPMAPLQRELYRLMKYEVAREARDAMSTRSKQAFRALGRSVSRLLQFVSNPALLGSELNFAHPDMLSSVLEEGDGPKMRYVLRRARKLALEGKKVLIWSSFVRNVEYIAERLSDLGAVYIHGGVDAGDEDDDETREGKIKLFHDDPQTMVMVANPAAASEGVSLHRVCHHAIYLDRTFNAAHYLQSEDRIHRFGLPKDQDTFVEIVECEGTVDETVLERLDYKIKRMAEALEDSSLGVDPIALDPGDIEDYEDYSVGLKDEDIQALLRDFERVAS
ncbi:DEAD/DEAH box helicase [Rhodoferax sp.]|uniref:DEAD/DEAH box helicase n=1 Tax=Rhodoferax sp. TaxID=50421 RepID=UPI0027280AF4|nr:DEAD/DEAH box helicase [Rhodoferax sp.]MDO9198595.1 DEAD/DEAH box helicase [Rhodoferax sp.]